MIYIDISGLRVTPEWEEQARQSTERLINTPVAERSDFINRRSHIWQDLKPMLEEISHNKCWYCEAKNTRADFHVDHHRPKSRVKNKDGTEETGYWWLAFDYRNFRLACSFCNCLHTGPDGITRGKSNQFPLRSGSSRASSSGSNLDDESPLLLDPTDPTDPSLLFFQDDGSACPKPSKTEGFLYQRAKVTIDILNLNDIKIVEARKDLWNRCINLKARCDRAFARYKKGSPTGKKEFGMVIREIRELVQSSAEFSATARACFRGSAYDWVRETVQ